MFVFLRLTLLTRFIVVVFVVAVLGVLMMMMMMGVLMLCARVSLAVLELEAGLKGNGSHVFCSLR